MKRAPQLKRPKVNNVSKNSSCLILVWNGKDKLTMPENAAVLISEGDGKCKKTDF